MKKHLPILFVNRSSESICICLVVHNLLSSGLFFRDPSVRCAAFFESLLLLQSDSFLALLQSLHTSYNDEILRSY